MNKNKYKDLNKLSAPIEIFFNFFSTFLMHTDKVRYAHTIYTSLDISQFRYFQSFIGKVRIFAFMLLAHIALI